MLPSKLEVLQSKLWCKLRVFHCFSEAVVNFVHKSRIISVCSFSATFHSNVIKPKIFFTFTFALTLLLWSRVAFLTRSRKLGSLLAAELHTLFLRLWEHSRSCAADCDFTAKSKHWITILESLLSCYLCLLVIRFLFALPIRHITIIFVTPIMQSLRALSARFLASSPATCVWRLPLSASATISSSASSSSPASVQLGQSRSYVKGLYEDELDTFNASGIGSGHSPRLVRGNVETWFELFLHFIRLLFFCRPPFYKRFSNLLLITFGNQNNCDSRKTL